MVPVCPKCDRALIVLRLHDVEIDVCDQCHGLWLDEGELEELLQVSDGHADERFVADLGLATTDVHPTNYLCPRCDGKLDQIRRETLALERCPEHHGIWFDEGELRHLLATFPAETGAARAIDHLNQFFRKPSMNNKGDTPNP